MTEEYKRAFTYGFKPMQLTVQEFAMQDGDVDWRSFLETFDTEHNIIPVKNDGIKISLMERAIISLQRELKASQAMALELEEKADILRKLEAAGVDNWEGYSEAFEDDEEDDDDEE